MNVIADYLDDLLESGAPASPPARTLPTAVPAPAPSDAPPVAALATRMSEAPAGAGDVRAGIAPARWLRVSVGPDSYALELLCVQEVVRLPPIVAMRGAARAVLGVMNLRGRIVPVVDLGVWLGTAPVGPDARSRIVVVERSDELVGVLVSAVEDVVTLGRDRIEPPVPGAAPGPVLGVTRVGRTPTVLLDAMALYG